MRKQPMMYQWPKNQNQIRTYKTYADPTTQEDILLDEPVEPYDVVICVDFHNYDGERYLCLTKFGMAYVFLAGWESI